MAKRLTIRGSNSPAMTVYRRAISASKLVYLICAPRAQKYEKGRSRIIYIGMTEKGVHRASGSMANKAIEFLEEWGIKRLDVHFVTCPPRSGSRSWITLERDLLVVFKAEYGSVPKGNTSGKNFEIDKLSRKFQSRRLKGLLASFEGSR